MRINNNFAISSRNLPAPQSCGGPASGGKLLTTIQLFLFIEHSMENGGKDEE